MEEGVDGQWGNVENQYQRRADLIAEMKTNGATLPPAIEAAFQKVPRHLFVPGVYLNAVYHDHPIVIITKRYLYHKAQGRKSLL